MRNLSKKNSASLWDRIRRNKPQVVNPKNPDGKRFDASNIEEPDITQATSTANNGKLQALDVAKANQCAQKTQEAATSAISGIAKKHGVKMSVQTHSQAQAPQNAANVAPQANVSVR